MGRPNPPQPVTNPVKFGVYACSQTNSSFSAKYSEAHIESFKWLAHDGLSQPT